MRRRQARLSVAAGAKQKALSRGCALFGQKTAGGNRLFFMGKNALWPSLAAMQQFLRKAQNFRTVLLFSAPQQPVEDGVGQRDGHDAERRQRDARRVAAEGEDQAHPRPEQKDPGDPERERNAHGGVPDPRVELAQAAEFFSRLVGQVGLADALDLAALLFGGGGVGVFKFVIRSVHRLSPRGSA